MIHLPLFTTPMKFPTQILCPLNCYCYAPSEKVIKPVLFLLQLCPCQPPWPFRYPSHLFTLAFTKYWRPYLTLWFQVGNFNWFLVGGINSEFWYVQYFLGNQGNICARTTFKPLQNHRYVHVPASNCTYIHKTKTSQNRKLC